MPLRKEEEKEICGTIYKFRQLPAATGAKVLLQISRVLFSGAGSLAELLQKEQIKKIIETFLTTSVVINDLSLEHLPPAIRSKAQALKGRSFDDIEIFREAISLYLSQEETAEHAVGVYQRAAFSSTPEFSNILSISGHLLELIQDIVEKVDPDEFENLLSTLINKSVIRYRPEKEDKFRPWLNTNNDYEFDEHFAGRYHELLEVFAYLALFNYAESFILLKKNQISTYLKSYLDKLKPKEETTESKRPNAKSANS